MSNIVFRSTEKPNESFYKKKKSAKKRKT